MPWTPVLTKPRSWRDRWSARWAHNNRIDFNARYVDKCGKYIWFFSAKADSNKLVAQFRLDLCRRFDGQTFLLRKEHLYVYGNAYVSTYTSLHTLFWGRRRKTHEMTAKATTMLFCCERSLSTCARNIPRFCFSRKGTTTLQKSLVLRGKDLGFMVEVSMTSLMISSWEVNSIGEDAVGMYCRTWDTLVKVSTDTWWILMGLEQCACTWHR